MRCILGIGNPGARYKNNRHNVGFMLIDYMAVKHSLPVKPSRYDYYFAEGNIKSSEFILIKPSNYVNNSGAAAIQVVNKYNINYQDLLVIVDDVNLETATLRLRKSGGDGGHNGLASIVYHLSSDKFARLRIGVGSNFTTDKMADYVLKDFNKDEIKVLEKSFVTASSLIEEFIIGGIKQLFDANSKIKPENNN